MNINKRTLIYIIIIILLILFNCLSVSRCRTIKYSNETNIRALTDTIKYFKTKEGALVTQKTMLSGDLSTLQKVNDSLYNIIKSTNVKSPDNVVYTRITIKDTKHDTVWTSHRDTLENRNYYNIYRKFNFSDRYRTLTGTSWFKSDGIKDSLGLTIDSNQVNADFTVIQKNDQVYITSNNPYIIYNNIIGISSKEVSKKKRFGVGPVLGVGINHKAQISPFIGIGINYNIFSF